MTPSWWTDLRVVAGLVGCAAGLLSFALVWRSRTLAVRESAEMRRLLEGVRGGFDSAAAELRGEFRSLENALREIPSPPEGSLGRSRRAEAIGLLQAGIAHSVVAERLDLGIREVRLLASLAELIPGH